MEKANRTAELKGMLYFFIFGSCNIYYKLIQRIVVTSAKRDRIPAETALHFTGNAHCFGLPLKFFLLIFILHPQEELLLLKVYNGTFRIITHNRHKGNKSSFRVEKIFHFVKHSSNAVRYFYR